MLPAAAVMIHDVPRTPNGKLDRRALPAPSERHSDRDESYVAPRDELERQLTAIWERELRVQPIGITENFFQLGGDSLTAVRVFSQIEKMLEKRLPFSPLFEAPTVEQLAEILRRGTWSPRSATLVEVRPTGRKVGRAGRWWGSATRSWRLKRP
jgi:aspartate racemase